MARKLKVLSCICLENFFISIKSIDLLSSGSRISQTGGLTPEFGTKTYYLARFSQKTNWTEKGARVSSTPLGSANDTDTKLQYQFTNRSI